MDLSIYEEKPKLTLRWKPKWMEDKEREAVGSKYPYLHNLCTEDLMWNMRAPGTSYELRMRSANIVGLRRQWYEVGLRSFP